MASVAISTASLRLSAPTTDHYLQNPKIYYALRCPVTGIVRYVGETHHALEVRLENHITKARDTGELARVFVWLRELDEQGLLPRIFQLPEPVSSEAEAVAIYRDRVGEDVLLNEDRGINSGRKPSIRWRSEHLALLGEISDRQLAMRMGVSRETVRRQRRLLQIPPEKPRVRIDWTSIAPLLGTMPDAQISRRFQISINAIRSRREAMNIPVFKP